MKKLICAALLIASTFICFSQENVKELTVIKDKTGIIQAVVFPDSIISSKIPLSSDAFF